jgi:hypothetical protein
MAKAMTPKAKTGEVLRCAQDDEFAGANSLTAKAKAETRTKAPGHAAEARETRLYEGNGEDKVERNGGSEGNGAAKTTAKTKSDAKAAGTTDEEAKAEMAQPAPARNVGSAQARMPVPLMTRGL